MTLYDLSLDFDENFSFPKMSTTGKISDEEIAVCFYNSKRLFPKHSSVGGKENSSYDFKSITILLRYTKNSREAERTALSIQDFYNERKTIINQKKVCFFPVYQEPISLGTDDSGVYEYSFEIDIYSER